MKYYTVKKKIELYWIQTPGRGSTRLASNIGYRCRILVVKCVMSRDTYNACVYSLNRITHTMYDSMYFLNRKKNQISDFYFFEL